MNQKLEDEFVKNLKGGSILSKFAISNKTIKLTKHGNEYLDVTLSDKTGEITGRMFSNGKLNSMIQQIENGDICTIKGNIEEYQGRLNLKISEMIGCSAEEFDKKDFLHSSEKNTDKLMEVIADTINQMKNPQLKNLLKLFFDNEKFKSEFCSAPAAVRMHHNYIGGLLEHTSQVLILCKTICQNYPELDNDLLFTGAILHDIGKMKIYRQNGFSIEYTEDGLLLEHIYISAQMVKERANKILISEETVKRVIHLILSHHGDVSNGWGSAVSPFLPEATALHQADNLDAKVKIALDKQK
ncbi:MAG: HD domain-containing protein [Methanobacteriaceae archaeon]|nr:HD domain-containing protein [Methanobacteriaceae archaeon]MDP2837639.1 HD domain-containing protein [Methanobacteriaceae archaeon]MDP3485678.1 HD domain-containing protein [Methanobacteriaceae archaeon]MDP3624379.1 HD domain-containing protein [Methanobacteriaceae archaeon]